jgi:hypothetical protein
MGAPVGLVEQLQMEDDGPIVLNGASLRALLDRDRWEKPSKAQVHKQPKRPKLWCPRFQHCGTSTYRKSIAVAHVGCAGQGFERASCCARQPAPRLTAHVLYT